MLTALTGRVPRKPLLLGADGAVHARQPAGLEAPGYGTLMAARVLTGLAHGVFFSIGSTIATEPGAEGKGRQRDRD